MTLNGPEANQYNPNNKIAASNAGAALAKIGVDTAITGKVGNDGLGDFLIKSLEKHGADCTGIGSCR